MGFFYFSYVDKRGTEMSKTTEKHTIAKDGKEMILIPGGEFEMGREDAYWEEKPVHKVTVKSFYMDKTLVTNRDYKKYCDEAGKPYPPNPIWKEMPHYFLDYPDYPVVNVAWPQAGEYASWAGKRLPSEEEWEYAACGGQNQPLYPWGEQMPEGSRVNFADRNTDYPWRNFNVSTGYRYTSPVGTYPPNAYGLFDMAGNVWEWCDDWFFPYDDTERDVEAFKDGWGGSRPCRGGCYHSSSYDLRVSRRRQVLGGQGLMSVGFRCARDIDVPAENELHAQQAGQPNEWVKKLENIHTTIGNGFELCCGVGTVTREQALHIKNLGFTSIEQYVTWETIENKGEGCWDFSVWDEQVKIMKEVGLKWVPFLIAGPAYALPDWYRESSDFEGLCCLEHNIETKIQSIWDRNFYQYIERFISRFAEHYKEDLDVIEAPLLGITGDFGESIFPVWHGNWPTQIPGLYHSHSGYWCSDRFAQKDFREKMALQYQDIEKLNASWGTTYNSFAAVTMPELTVDPVSGFRVDEYTIAGKHPVESVYESVRWLDFVDWYRESMTEYVDFWMGVTRKYFPEHPIYLCTGGDAVSNHGSNFAQQCKITAKHGGGVRITNEASKYAQNFFLTNWVASAGNFYHSYFSFEPAGQVTERGVVCRIYNATVTGAKGLHYYMGNLFDEEGKVDIFRENVKHLYMGQVKKEIGVIYPDTAVLLNNITQIDMQKNFEILRDYTDYQYMDDLTIRDGILDTVKCAVICCGEVYRKETLEAVKSWVEKGGILIGYNIGQLQSVEGEDYGNLLYNTAGGMKAVGAGVSLYIPVRIKLEKYDPDMIPGTKPAVITLVESLEYYQKNIFDLATEFLKTQGYHVTDGKLDEIYAALLENRVVLLNAAKEQVERDIVLPGGVEKKVVMKYNSILEVKY
jgi:formylglycine-generating enzyme